MKEFQMTKGTFIKDKNSTSKIMMHLFISLVPIIIFSIYKNGYLPYKNGLVNTIGLLYPLIFILVGMLSTYIIELLYVKIFLKKNFTEVKEYMKSSYSIFPGLFLALTLPINTPITILLFGAFMAVIVGKMLFGGFGNNIFNPALIGCLFVMLIYGPFIASNGGYLNKLELDSVTGATPLSNISTIEGIGTYDTIVKPFGSLTNFAIGTIPGAIGETSAILCIIAFIYLSLTKVIKWKIPVVYVGTVFVMTYMIGSLNDLTVWYPLFQILSGGLLFGAVFMATDPVTSPVTPIGQILYGLFLGILTVMIRYITPYPEGVLTSILTLNMFIFIIDKIGAKSRFNFNKATMSFILAWVLIVLMSFNIGNSFKNLDGKVDAKFNIVNKEIVDGRHIYTVTQKGFSGNIKAKVIIESDKIVSVDIIEIHDDYYPQIKSNNYLEKLVGADQLDNVDTISGATITSSAIKTMLINTMKDYNGE